jgi:hypothetical protein
MSLQAMRYCRNISLNNAINLERFNFNGVITFNEVGAEVFNMLDGSNSVEEIVTISSALFLNEIVSAPFAKFIANSPYSRLSAVGNLGLPFSNKAELLL